MAATMNAIEIQGRDVTLWTANQLENLSLPVLRSRAMDLRDLLGPELLSGHNIPRMPRHPEVVIQWILAVQDLLPGMVSAIEDDGADRAAATQDGRYNQECGYGDVESINSISKVPRSSPGSSVGDHDYAASRNAYVEGRNVAEVSRMRSRGQSGLLSWA